MTWDFHGKFIGNNNLIVQRLVSRSGLMVASIWSRSWWFVYDTIFHLKKRESVCCVLKSRLLFILKLNQPSARIHYKVIISMLCKCWKHKMEKIWFYIKKNIHIDVLGGGWYGMAHFAKLTLVTHGVEQLKIIWMSNGAIKSISMLCRSLNVYFCR